MQCTWISTFAGDIASREKGAILCGMETCMSAPKQMGQRERGGKPCLGKHRQDCDKNALHVEYAKWGTERNYNSCHTISIHCSPPTYHTERSAHKIFWFISSCKRSVPTEWLAPFSSTSISDTIDWMRAEARSNRLSQSTVGLGTFNIDASRNMSLLCTLNGP